MFQWWRFFKLLQRHRSAGISLFGMHVPSFGKVRRIRFVTNSNLLGIHFRFGVDFCFFHHLENFAPDDLVVSDIDGWLQCQSIDQSTDSRVVIKAFARFLNGWYDEDMDRNFCSMKMKTMNDDHEHFTKDDDDVSMQKSQHKPGPTTTSGFEPTSKQREDECGVRSGPTDRQTTSTERLSVY